ncbi:MAG TPA: copper resistance protein CopC [Dehalococcoidia bacterium]|nr:copper resistance protein CopC [Dehalococcoidia bacterium]
MRRLLAVGAAIAAAGAAFALVVSIAGAHARLDESTPAVGEVVQTSPPQVSVTFTQEIQKITGTYGIDVFDANENEVTTQDAVLSDADRRILTVDLPPSLPAGRYVVRYKNVSDEDGDPFEGAYAFYVGRQPTAAELAADAELTQEEAEETPTAAAATSTPAAQATSAATAVATPASTADDDDSGGNITLILVVVGLVVLVVLVLAGFFALSRSQSGNGR